MMEYFDSQKDYGLVYIIGGAGCDLEDNMGNDPSYFLWEEEILKAVFEEVLGKYST